MAIDRRQFLSSAAGAVAAPAVLRASPARAADVVLKLHHFLPATSNAHQNFLLPWSKKIEAESGGRLKIQIFPSMQLGGTPPQLFDQARDGVVDLIWTLPGNTPGRFPKIEVIELPFIGAQRGIVNSRAIQEFSEKHLKDELHEVHPICVWANDRNVFHARKEIRTMEDLKGLKIRFPARLAGEALKTLGANAIGMPIPQVPESLAQGVLDGCLVPWEVVPALKIHELVKFHTEIPGSPTLYTSTHLLAMNKARFASLPAELKDVLDRNSGQLAASMAGRAWDDMVPQAMALVQRRSNSVYTLPASELERWKAATRPVTDAWLAQMKDKGTDGGKLVEEMQALVAKYDKA
ncbi:TRAP transporter substrate-binding protein [Chelatococcus sp. SYSU_G07232]|uniref:TRAP transporter substrate-binding protein n=1 Tax=Chelatococcus albus TaxID=3047466 RepID=A0ABT7ACG0_9HYPH|nr:TRAP transporter substrate-binding protein [Chelatococcus sp. SYSU_G07232]MDJ1157047.1 TRAP transporter substrate-binding protein [Chelatococcus sp. SYSU_G07232]